MAVERLRAENYDEFIEFADLVFSQDLIRVHFQEDLPLLFAPDDEHMHWQYAYRDDSGRIRATIGVIPYTYVIDGRKFNARTITTVATHYRHTGKGYMQSIMKKVFEDMEAENVDFAVLHGNRERYRFWGFEPAGVSELASFESYNIVNREKKGETFPYTFQKIEETDTDMIQKCLEMFHTQPQHYERTPEKFMLFQGMWRGVPYAIYDEKGVFCGYLNYQGGGIRELLLKSPAEAARVVNSFLKEKELTSIVVAISPFVKEGSRSIYDAAEYVHASQTTRLNLLKPVGFVEACLNLKAKDSYMPKGELVLESKFGKWLIKNDGSRFTVEETEMKADLIVPDDQIYGLLFGPSPRIYSLFTDVLKEKGLWFPVPFYIHNTDLY